MRGDDNRHPTNDARSGIQEDEKVERAVLALALAAYPHELSIEALASELASGSGGPEERTAAEQAVSSLVDHGLLKRHGALISPTRAARRFDHLGL